MPLVSIVIPVYNGEQVITRSVACCLNQTAHDVEVIVVDDGSIDSTANLVAQIAQQDPRVVLYQHLANKGRLEARRTGINAATAPFIMFLDADDELLPDAIEQAFMAHNGQYDIVQLGFDVRYNTYVPEEKRQADNKLLQPPTTVKTGDDVTHLFFRDRKTSWSLCAKLMRTEHLKAAIAQVPEQPMQRAEDACIFFIVSCMARSYRGVPFYKGYVYNIDEGGSAANSSHSSVEDFEYNCHSVEAMECVRNYLLREGRFEALRADYEVMRSCHSRASAEKLLLTMNKNDMPQALERFTAIWPAQEAISSIAAVGWDNAGDTICALASSAALKVAPHDIKTVGIYHYSMQVGGAERVAGWQANLLHSMGYKVVFFADEPREQCVFDLPESIPWVQLPPSFETKADTYSQRADLIAGAVHDYGIDAFVHHQWWNPLLPWDIMLIKALGIPFVLYNHAPYKIFFAQPHPWELENVRAVRFVDGMVVLSEEDKNFWSKFTPRVWQTPNPSTLNPATAPQSNLRSHEIVWVGRLASYDKQPMEAVKIFAEVAARDPQAKLTFVGTATSQFEFMQLKAFIKANGLENRIELAGQQKNVLPFYERAGLMLVTSNSESWGLALAEGMACGLPVVMYEIPHLALAKNNEGIVSVPQGDYHAAAEAILGLLENSEERILRGKHAHNYISAVANFDFQAFWQTIISELAKGSPERTGFEEADDEWDTVLAGFQTSMAKAIDLRVLSYGKRKVFKYARKAKQFLQ